LSLSGHYNITTATTIAAASQTDVAHKILSEMTKIMTTHYCTFSIITNATYSG
jgi:hypothetical protein